MLSILQIWSEFTVDEVFENEIVKLILEKVVEIREHSIKRATLELIRQLEEPGKRFKPNNKYA
jgi:hypothetical protein